MKVELTARWIEKNSDPDELENFKLKRLLNDIEDGEDSPEGPYKYVYSPIVMEMDLVNSFNMLDDDHTILRMGDGVTYCIKIGFYSFLELYSRMTGTNIARIEEVKPEPRKKRSSKKFDIDKDEEI